MKIDRTIKYRTDRSSKALLKYIKRELPRKRSINYIPLNRATQEKMWLAKRFLQIAILFNKTCQQ